MGKTKRGKTKRGKTKGGIIWGPPDAESDYRELAVMVSSAKKSSDNKKLYEININIIVLIIFIFLQIIEI